MEAVDECAQSRPSCKAQIKNIQYIKGTCSKILYSSTFISIKEIEPMLPFNHQVYVTPELRGSSLSRWPTSCRLLPATVCPRQSGPVWIFHDLSSSKIKIIDLCFLARWRIPTHLLVKPLKRRKKISKKNLLVKPLKRRKKTFKKDLFVKPLKRRKKYSKKIVGQTFKKKKENLQKKTCWSNL